MFFCGECHQPEKCPAKGKICHQYNVYNHFAILYQWQSRSGSWSINIDKYNLGDHSYEPLLRKRKQDWDFDSSWYCGSSINQENPWEVELMVVVNMKHDHSTRKFYSVALKYEDDHLMKITTIKMTVIHGD